MSGDKIPWWIKKGVPNPMKSKITREKVSASVKKTFKEKNIGEIISKKKKGQKPKPMSEKALKAASERMKKNNPMKNPDAVNKMRISYKKRINEKEYIHPNKGRKRPDAAKRMNTKNPMKDPDTAKKVWEKAMRTILKNDNLSKGQKKLYELLDCLEETYIKEKYFKINRQDISWAYADAYLPKYKLIIEYDGIGSHYSKEGMKYDLKRDRELKFLYKVSILRLSRDTVFANDFRETLKEAIHEIKMEKSPIRKKIGEY